MGKVYLLSLLLPILSHHSSAQLTHNCPPLIVLGQTGSCTCQSIYSGTVQWINPQGQIVYTRSTSVSISLANIPRSNNGHYYSCRTWNPYANKTISFSFNIAYGPSGVSITGNTPTAAPDVLTLTCTTTYYVNPAPTLTWRNSTNGPVLSGSSPVYLGSSQYGGYNYRSNLSITTQWYQDGDTIVCEGKNPRIQSQQPLTDQEVMDINYPPQSRPVISGISSSAVYEGDSVTLTCGVVGGKPLVTTVTLTCPGGHQSSTTRTEGSDTKVTTLTFPVNRDLIPQPCRCSAVHSTGRYQLTANMTKSNIYYPPTRPTVSLSQSFPWLEGRRATLTCSLIDAGNPGATYIWYRDGVRQTQQTGQSWQFSSLTYTDDKSRIYCQAENQFTMRRGPVIRSSTQTLNVNFSPKLTVGMDEVSIVGVQVGENTTLFRTLYSKTNIISYTWWKEGQILNNTLFIQTTVQVVIRNSVVEVAGYNFTLNIGPFEYDIHQGQYNLQVCNSVGCESSRINLIASGPPLTPKEFQVLENTTQTSMWLSWKPNFPGGNNYTQEFIVEYRIPGADWKKLGSFAEDDVMVVEVSSLSAGTMYEFRLYAENTRKTENRSHYTAILQRQTKRSVAGPVVGSLIAIGAVVAVVGVFILYRKGYRCPLLPTKQDNQDEEDHGSQQDNNRAISSIGPSASSAVSTYAKLGQKTPSNYTQMRLSEISEGPGVSSADSTYANLGQKTPSNDTQMRLNENSEDRENCGSQEVYNRSFSSIGPGVSLADSTYANLGQKTPSNYTQMRLNENSEETVLEDTGVSDGVQARTSALYQNVCFDTHENVQLKSEEPVYANT